MIECREKETLRRKMDKDEHREIYGGLGEGVRMKTYLQDPKNAARKLKLQYPGGGPGAASKKEEVHQ